MLKIEHYQTLVDAAYPNEFLALMEAHFKANYINRYMYIFLPEGAQFNAQMIELHYYGYEASPKTLHNISTYLSSKRGARLTKHTALGLLRPVKNNSDLLDPLLRQAKSVEGPDYSDTQSALYIPVHAGRSHTGLFYLSGKADQARMLSTERSTQLMCQLLHQRYCELWVRPNNKDINFTGREREIINWMSKGKSNSVIGDILEISKHTVDAHLRVIFFKLSVSNRTAAAVKASQLGLLVPQDL